MGHAVGEDINAVLLLSYHEICIPSRLFLGPFVPHTRHVMIWDNLSTKNESLVKKACKKIAVRRQKGYHKIVKAE